MESSILLDQTGRMLMTAGMISLVLMLPVMIVGLIISIVQGATSIQEQTLSFVPKVIALGLCIIAFASLITGLLTNFTSEVFALIAAAGR